MVRIFVSPSHLCTLYMILYARATRKDGMKDVLVLDSPPKKRSLIDLIKSTKNIYPWDAIIDLSIPLSDNTELVPNAKKLLTRKLKSKWLVKPFYDALHWLHGKKKRHAETAHLHKKLEGLGNVAEVNVLTQTLVNQTLFGSFPDAKINYFEHGSGDYFLIEKVKQRKFDFYCVFAKNFRTYLSAKGVENNYVKSLLGMENFPNIAQQVIDADPRKEEILKQYKLPGKLVVVLLEAMQLYNVPDHYYTDYIDLCMQQVPNPHDYTFVIKPHPAQTTRSIIDSRKRLEEHYKVNTIVLESAHLVNFSVEVLFTLWKDQAEYFFGTYSSAIFYNSVLYPNSKTRFFYTYDFFLNYLENAPKQFIEIYKGIEEPVKKVFSARCTSMA